VNPLLVAKTGRAGTHEHTKGAHATRKDAKTNQFDTLLQQATSQQTASEPATSGQPSPSHQVLEQPHPVTMASGQNAIREPRHAGTSSAALADLSLGTTALRAPTAPGIVSGAASRRTAAKAASAGGGRDVTIREAHAPVEALQVKGRPPAPRPSGAAAAASALPASVLPASAPMASAPMASAPMASAPTAAGITASGVMGHTPPRARERSEEGASVLERPAARPSPPADHSPTAAKIPMAGHNPTAAKIPMAGQSPPADHSPTAATSPTAGHSPTVGQSPTAAPMFTAATSPQGSGSLPGVAGQLVRVLSAPQPLADGSTTVTIALDPPSLGLVKATVVAGADQLSVHLVTTTALGAEALRLALPDLQSVLSAGGHQVHLTVSDGSASTSEGLSSAPQGGGGQSPFTSQHHAPAPPPPRSPSHPTSTVARTTALRRASPPSSSHLVDIRI